MLHLIFHFLVCYAQSTAAARLTRLPLSYVHNAYPLTLEYLTRSKAETTGKVGLSGRVVLLCRIWAQNAGDGRNFG